MLLMSDPFLFVAFCSVLDSMACFFSGQENVFASVGGWWKLFSLVRLHPHAFHRTTSIFCVFENLAFLQLYAG